MKNLSDINIWKQSFGLLPIHLNHALNEPKYLMLNGGYGDFCLQTIKDESAIADYYSKSWSSNTKNFVVIDQNKVLIFNWTKEKPEEAPLSTVSENIDKFYKYLLTKSYKSDRDVVPFIIDIFRQFRNLTLEKTNPVEALNLLFVLLTSLEDNIENFDRNKWNINEVHVPNEFDYYTEKLKSGVNNIKPELDLILRHSAGILFQEAQKEVLFFNPQRELFGGISSQIHATKNLYSSIHYTPPFLARTIVENALRKVDLNKYKIKIFDPACGSSEFLIESLKQLRELEYSGLIEIIGWDSSETAINTSNFLLKYEQKTIWNNRLSFDIKIVEDSLTEVWDNDYDLILMNPPFVSWEFLDKKSRDSVSNALGKNFNGKPNQASAFFYKSVKSICDDGIIGCVIPSSLLTLDSYKKLREELKDILTFNIIGKLGNFVFEDALTDVSFIVGNKPKVNSVPTILWTRNEKGVAQDALRDLRKMYFSNALTINEKNYSIFQPISFPIISESWKPVSLKENNLLKNVERFVNEKKLARVEDIFNVQQGIRTGNNDIFKISQNEFDKLPINEQIYFRPVADSKSIKNGSITITNYVWYPYSEDKLMLKTEDEFMQEVPIYYSKIVSAKNMLSIGRARKSISNWWTLSEHRAWLRKKSPRLISSAFGNSSSFAFDKDGLLAIQGGNAWLPKKKFDNSDFYFYLSIFSSNVFDDLLSIYSKELAGGNWYDLGKKYTKQIPIPDYSSETIKNSDIYNKLVTIGKELSHGNSYVKTISNEILNKYFYPEI